MKGGFVCCLLLLIMVFMFSATTDASRNSGWMKKEVALPDIHFQDKVDSMSDKENIRYDESAPRRLDIEDMDYEGTGANARHDPRSPGRA